MNLDNISGSAGFVYVHRNKNEDPVFGGILERKGMKLFALREMQDMGI